MLAPKKRVFALALIGERIEADQDVVDQAGVTHHDAIFRQMVEKLLHQRAEIGWPGEIIGAGEAGIERDAGAPGAVAKLRAQDVEHQRLGRTKPLAKRLTATALAHPGAGSGFLDRRQKCVADLRKQLRMLVTIDKIRRAAEQLAESRELHPHFGMDDLGIELSQ